jgi:transmembrane sensor
MKRDASGAKWEEQPLEWPRAVGRVDLLMAALDVRKRRQRRRRSAMVMSGVTVVLLAGFAWFLVPQRTQPADHALVAARAAVVTAPERQTLPDGSIVEFNTGAEISVEFKADAADLRRVTLRGGGAHFQVAHDAARPFVVEVRGVQFQAVGTAFFVEVDSSSIEMLVTEGKVAVVRATPAVESSSPSPGAAVAETSLLLEVGQAVFVDTTEPTVFAPRVLSPSASERAEKLAWRVPRLQFNETRLAEIVVLIARYGGTRIKLAHPELGQLEITGALRADNVEPLLQMLESNYQIRVKRLPGGEIELHRGH